MVLLEESLLVFNDVVVVSAGHLRRVARIVVGLIAEALIIGDVLIRLPKLIGRDVAILVEVYVRVVLDQVALVYVISMDITLIFPHIMLTSIRMCWFLVAQVVAHDLVLAMAKRGVLILFFGVL